MRMGMYGLMIIDPKVPLEAAREYGIVMGEYSDITRYGTETNLSKSTVPVMFDKKNNHEVIGDPRSTYQVDPRLILPKYFINNGYVDQYLYHPLPAWKNELVRLYVVNDGVGLVYPFHIHAQIFKAYPSGLISGDGWSNKPEYRQTVLHMG